MGLYVIRWAGNPLKAIGANKCTNGKRIASNEGVLLLNPSIRVRKPDAEIQVGGTKIKIFAPEELAEAEQQYRHQEIVRSIADCLKAARGKPEKEEA